MSNPPSRAAGAIHVRWPSGNPHMHVGGGRVVGGRYRLLGPAATSPWGQAFRAEQLSNAQPVCIHVVGAPVHEDALDSEFSLAVARSIQLSHRNAVTLRGYGRSKALGDSYYVVSDPLLGVSLSEYLGSRDTLPLGQALSFAHQIARGLRAAHRLELYHGALTPDAVRVIETNGQTLLQVVGLCPLPSLVVDAQPSSHVGDLVTLAYAAPELRAGVPMNERSDVYSLGMILLRMVAGSDALSEASSKLLRGTVTASWARSEQERTTPTPTLPAELAALLTEATAVDPEDRFLDVAAMERAIRGCEDPLKRACDAGGSQNASRPGSRVSTKGSSRWTDTVRALLAHHSDMARVRHITWALVLVVCVALAWSMGSIGQAFAW